MARYIEGVCRFCRRDRTKLFLKGERCYTDKCALEKRPTPPGQHGAQRTKLSDYGVQLREKQKAKRFYGILERQFRNYVRKATATRGITGEVLFRFLECRLDNLVFRMGFASSRREARQLVRNRHFLVNGKIVNIPSYQVDVNDEIVVKDRSKSVQRIVTSLEGIDKRGMMKWFEVDKTKMTGRLLSYPSREELVDLPINERLIIELYSK